MPKFVDIIIVNRVHLAKTSGFYRFVEKTRRGGCASAGADAQAQGGPMHIMCKIEKLAHVIGANRKTGFSLMMCANFQ